jgi:hypothetical protein
MDINNILQEFKERLEAIYGDNLKKVILFGSYARGDYDSESDIDVLVVLESIVNYRKECKKARCIEQELEKKYDYKFLVCSVFTTMATYESRTEPLFLNIKREGVLL